MRELFGLMKFGAKSALWAAIINTILGIIKTAAYLITGNVAMFAEMMHSFGDAANQFFVFIGSGLSKKSPTERFPGGFGRLVNLVLLGAVLIVGILAYETIIEGIHHIQSATHSEDWFWLNVGVLGVAIILELFVLHKAMKEITHNLPKEQTKGMKIVPLAYKNVKNANPATKLVFLEDNVAVGGAVLALIAIVIATYTPFHSATGYASVIIGIMLVVVVGRIFLDNAAGVLGVADLDMEERMGNEIMKHPKINDIQDMAVIREGDDLHVELKVEVEPDMTIKEADEIREYIAAEINKRVPNVTDIIIEFDQDDDIVHWKKVTTQKPVE
ncbi:cation diffusion facilitator family transporter [Planococcus halotolerans]|uniref:Cation transporter n=1 Tax=Planococcus halotolerans TaxID=2233542 RepID=A0A365KRG7_9BACL|nr:cation diffusion facilitator family transporter [Planococcus halotolerans]QHJ69450.1 cation diffusion facilitator family transporter [Planococcus halotolerans]RAZ75402.1 cation transporter [Planococcus halotolerans]